MISFSYQAEKFAAARRNLMLPHPKGEAHSIVMAFHECALGLRNLNYDELDGDARNWLKKLNYFMDTSGLEDRTGRGLWEVKAENLTEPEKIELSHSIDELAHWFKREFWGQSK